MKHVTPYQAKSFDLHGLTGISDRTLDMHFKLYAGYVKETNTLTDRIRDVLKDGKVDQDGRATKVMDVPVPELTQPLPQEK